MVAFDVNLCKFNSYILKLSIPGCGLSFVAIVKLNQCYRYMYFNLTQIC